MKSEILKTFTNNWGFKLLAVFFAAIMWLVVYNTNDPNITRSFTTTVSIENQDANAIKDKYYEVINGSNSITFYATGKKSVMDKLDENDFTAVADLNNLVYDTEDDTRATVKITVSCTNSSYAHYVTVKTRSKQLEVAVEEKMESSFNIVAKTSGELADGYALGSVKIQNSNVLRVSGPASIVKRIDSVVATVDVKGFSEDCLDNSVVLKLYDENNEVIDTTKLTLSINMVSVAVQVLRVKELPINIITSGRPAANATVQSVTCNPSTVIVKGVSKDIDSISSVDVQSDALDVSGATEDITTTINITDYLPEGITIVDADKAMITVEIKIESYGSKTIDLPSSNIEVKGLSEGYELSFAKSSISLNVSGIESDLNNISADTIKGSIDVSSLGEGTHTVVLVLDLDTSKYTYDTISVRVTISKKASDNGGSDDTGNGDDGGNSVDPGTPEDTDPQDEDGQ